jgi:hypothetical protein
MPCPGRRGSEKKARTFGGRIDACFSHWSMRRLLPQKGLPQWNHVKQAAELVNKVPATAAKTEPERALFTEKA